MKSITVHNMADKLYESIKEEALRKGLSMNRTIKQLLEKAVGLQADKHEERAREFKDLFHLWNKEDLRKFEADTAGLRKIDTREWL